MNQNLTIPPSPSVVLILRIGISRSVLLHSSNQGQITFKLSQAIAPGQNGLDVPTYQMFP